MRGKFCLMLACALALPLQASGLEILQLGSAPLERVFSIDAVIEPTQQTLVSAQVAGNVLEAKVDAGASVRKGELLMQLDAREAQERLRQTEATLNNARAQLARIRSLVERQFMSQAALDKAQADFELARAEQAAAAVALSHARVLSPINGVVARRHVEPGDLAMPGKPLFTLYQPGALRALASVPQSRVPAIRAQGRARVELPEIGRTVEAVSITVLPMADTATHASLVRVQLPDGLQLSPGAFARVHFIEGQDKRLLLPASAVLRRGEVAGVYVQTQDGAWRLRQIRLGEVLPDGRVEVLSGLAEGERIAADPLAASLRTGP